MIGEAEAYANSTQIPSQVNEPQMKILEHKHNSGTFLPFIAQGKMSQMIPELSSNIQFHP